MAKPESWVEFNPRFFDAILKQGGVAAFTRSRAEAVRDLAVKTAPVDTGDYRDGLKVESRESAHRRVYRVVGHDKKTMLVEAKTGNLARAVRNIRRSS